MFILNIFKIMETTILGLFNLTKTLERKWVLRLLMWQVI